MNIWQTLKKPIYILAPMEDVTDTVFRRVIISCGRPDLFFTEFTNVDGMHSEGSSEVSKRLSMTPKEKPIIAQIWGLKPENYYLAAKKIAEMGYDGIDINMGCPQKNVTSRGACAALMKNKTLAKEIIQATQEGSCGLPVSIKTRIGYTKPLLEEWIGFLLEQKLTALTVHGRTVAEMSKVPAHWNYIGEAATLRNTISPQTYIIGNGDVVSLEDAKEKAQAYNLDGIMIGRGIFNNPWLFNTSIQTEDITIKNRLDLLLSHVRLYDKTWGKRKNFQILKKYFKIYVSNFEGAQQLRIQLMQTSTGKEVEDIVAKFQKDK